MDIRSFQQKMRDEFLQTDQERGLEATFMWMVEEVGELSAALRGKTDGDNLRDEFADVFAWLCSLANLADVDLQDACAEKYSSQRIKADKQKHRTGA